LFLSSGGIVVPRSKKTFCNGFSPQIFSHGVE
jgi:hypothetical protein